MKLKKISDIIKNSNRIAILPHIDVDGDCIGSSFALLHALKELGKTAQVILEDPLPSLYSFLPGTYIAFKELPSNYEFDICICLDSSDVGRLGERIGLIERSTISINIDHHVTNTKYALYNCVDSQAAATGEIIFELIQTLGISFNSAISENLYVAIATDTGGFRYTNTTSRTHRIVAKLLQTDIDIGSINRKIFETVSLKKLKLMSDAVNRIELYDGGKVAVIVLDINFINKFNIKYEDTDGVSSLPRTLEGVEVGVVLTEKAPQKVKVSFRSNDYVDVSEIALSFGGGGHSRASGCLIEMDIEQVKSKVLEAIREKLKD